MGDTVAARRLPRTSISSAVPGAELHTNFSLQASGEYLALVAPDKVTILQEFAPEFSRHEADESFGVPFDGVPLVSSGAAARVLVPANGALGTTWTTNGFGAGACLGHAVLTGGGGGAGLGKFWTWVAFTMA